MALRDVLVTLLILSSIPYILARPWIGILAWSWLAFMNPHRLCWGFAYGLPFSMVIGLTVLVSMVMSKEPKKMLWTRETITMAVFLLWMLITTLNAHYPESAWSHFDKVSKIFLMTAVTVILMQDPKRLHLMVMIIAMSICFYGVKGGFFVIRSGGGEMVLGPRGSFMATHGEIGMGMTMAVPLLRYTQLHITNLSLLPKELRRFMPQQIHRLIQIGFMLAMFLTGLAILGTQSRGAMLSGAMIAIFFIWKSRQKMVMLFLLAIAVPIMLSFMADSWFAHMDTISTEKSEMDRSASQRLNSWEMAATMASHELTGGGYNSFRGMEFAMYAPYPVVADAHNNFFEVLGEHGWPGLILYVLLGAMTWFKASKIARKSKRHRQLFWLSDLARMCQVSIVAYVASGTFIGQAYFDLFYAIVAIIVLSDHLLERELKKIDQTEADQSSAPGTATPKLSKSWKAYGGRRAHPSA